MKIEKFIDGLSMEAWIIIVAIVLLLIASSVFIVRKLMKNPEKSNKAKKGGYWTKERIKDYIENAKRDPQKYGYI